MNSYTQLYKRICRLCLSVNLVENTTCLTGKASRKQFNYFGKAIMFLCDIKLTNTTKLPQYICKNCKQLLNQAVSFKSRCETSDKKLRRLMKMNVGQTQNIQEVICEYVLFNQMFPSKSEPLTQNTISTTNKPEKMKKNDLKPSTMISSIDEVKCDKVTTKTVNIPLEDSINRYEDINTNKRTVKHDKSNEIDNILDSIQESINTNYLLDDSSHNNEDIESECKTKSNKPRKKIKTNTGTLSRSTEIDGILNSIDYIINSNKIKSSLQKKILKRKIKGELPLTSKRNIECEICHKILANQLTYNHHMQRHSICQYICEHCGKGFPTVAELRRHQVNRHGIGPYLKCDHCPFIAAEKKDLVEHLRKHTGERPFTCEKCGLTFRRRAIYKNHLVYHGEKKYKCCLCPMKFYRQSEVDSHSNNIHERKYVYMCRVCNVTYTKTATVRRHMINKHGIARDVQGPIIRVKSRSVPDTN